MIKNKSIAMLVCYYGKLPWYFDYFAHSCKYNPSVDFYIITDDDTYQDALPRNVKLIYKTLSELIALAEEKFGFAVDIRSPYKLCDFKPAYGYLFSDILKDYDFWGHCDIDMIFGNIRDFMTDELLDSYDLISVRPDWIPGCFLLFRNDARMNLLFSHSKDYQKVFSSWEHFCFDETNFTHYQFEDGKPYYEIKSNVESMMHLVKRMEECNYIKPYFDLHIIEGGSPGKLKWQDGRVIYKNKFEVLAYHLIDFKRHFIPRKKHRQIPDWFTISSTSIYHKKSRQVTA